MKKKKVLNENEPEKVKLRFKPLNFIIYALILAIVFVLGYLVTGLIESLIITIGLAFVLLIGSILDKPKKGKGRKVLKIVIIIFLVLFILGVCGVCGFLYYVVKNAPDFKQELLKERESNIIYDSDVKEYAKLVIELLENI